MLIVFPSDPATQNASTFLSSQGVAHKIIEIPDSLGYRTGALTGLYFENGLTDSETLMLSLSAAGHVIMRVFKTWIPELTP